MKLAPNHEFILSDRSPVQAQNATELGNFDALHGIALHISATCVPNIKNLETFLLNDDGKL
jgi:hypothetical protein